MEMPTEYWWEKKSKPHEQIYGIVRFLQKHQSSVHQQNIRSLRLYGNYNVLGITASTYSQNQNFMNPTDRVALNIVKSMVDTVTNKIAKNKPKPMFLTEGGNWKQQRKAKRLGKFIDGKFYEMDIYAKGLQAFRDACIFGTGALKYYREGSDICVERVFIDEIVADLNESLYGEPRSIYQTKYIPREVLCRMYPEHEIKIKMAKQADDFRPLHQGLSNNVVVVESWHLPSGKDAKDGRHVICIENETLFDEVYEKDSFPFVFLRWTTRPIGFYGAGLAEELQGLQIEINKILRTIQISFHLTGIPWILIESGSKVNKAHLNNEIAHGVVYSGTPPQVYTPTPVNPQLFEHLERLYMKAYQVAGVSELAAQSQKPAGLNSGKALREFNDIESERFITIGQAYENFYMEGAKRIVDLAKEIHEDGEDPRVLAKHKSCVQEIKWSEVDLKQDEYIMQVFPVSSLSSSPAGRLQDIQEFIQAGLIPQEFATKLMDFPDLEEFLSLANASIEDIERTIEQIIDEGEYQPPEPFQRLDLGIQMMQSAYLKAKADKVEEERLELMRRWISEADALTQAAKQAQMQEMAQQQAMSPQGAPQGQAMAAPTSEMMVQR